MQILVVGDERSLSEVKTRFGNGHQYLVEGDYSLAERLFNSVDVVFDFLLEENQGCIDLYADKSPTLFVNTAKVSLAELVSRCARPMKPVIFGFNGLPTFLSMELLEVSLLKNDDASRLAAICQQLGTAYSVVSDRVGLVTPRVICMIINEAYFTAQEGTASRDDIDKGMKLGTNYPYGPFEWAQRIGVSHVYEVLEALYNDTHDERYKVAPLLKREYLLS
jgi:3-hydroxybutyryl-CoA dehydrogenase